MNKRALFKHPVLPYLLLAPQVAITLIFFVWPASQGLFQSVMEEDPFGLESQFIGLDNFVILLEEPAYIDSLGVTAFFSVAVTVTALSVALLLAAMADRVFPLCQYR